MPERIINNLLNSQQRQEFLRGLPVFSHLSDEKAAALVALMYERKYKAGEKIVYEGDLIDNVYIITEGEAEVTRKKTKRNKLTHQLKTTEELIATLASGESIGLNDFGFFSTTGKRTATITTLTEVKTLVIDLKELHHFLKEHKEIESSLYSESEQILKIKLIKQVLPFSHLSHERLQWLASKVEEILIPAGTVIFKQGEVGDRCYLIRSGHVEINRVDDEDQNHLATLRSPTLFGEATLITHSPRNATAIAQDDCDLFMLRHEYLSELIESEHNVAHMFMSLMVDRSRPERNPDITVHHRLTADKQPVVILKNPKTSNYFKLSSEGWYIWQQLNGRHTMQSITISLADKYNLFAPDVVAALISKLAKAGFIKNVEVEQPNHTHHPIWIRSLTVLRKVLEKRVVIGDADKWIHSIYNKIRPLLTRTGLIILGIVALLGFISFCVNTREVILIFRAMPNSWLLILLLIPFTLLSVGLHELGHAVAMKSFGYEVHYMGIGWYWMSPVVFTDTSDMWLSTPGPRLAVNLAGVATDLVVAGVAALFIWLIPNLYVKAFLWIFAIYTYLSAFRMLSPFQELDGYYILMDLLEKNHLRHRAVSWLVKDFPQIFSKNNIVKKHKPEVFYWIACLSYLILLCIITWYVQAFVFKILGFKPASPWVSLIIPLLVVIISSLGVIADIRSETEE